MEKNSSLNHSMHKRRVHKLRQATDSAADKWNDLIEDTEELVTRVAKIKDPAIELVREKVETALTSARQSVNRQVGQLREQVGTLAESTDNLVRLNPWQALGAAAVLGVAFGYLLSNRRE